MKKIDFYFDFMSPYAYLAYSQFPALAEKYGYEVEYHPIDLKATKLAAGNTGPATVQMPKKLKYAMADIGRWAKKYKLPFAFSNEPPISERANKGAFFAKEKGQEAAYIETLWKATFGSGGGFNNDEVLRCVAKDMGWGEDEFFAYVHSDEADSLYKSCSEAAQERGVFGVPTMMIGEEMWWGNDRLELLEEYLKEHAG